MSSLLTLAKDLEQQSKAQQKHTETMLKTVFSEHERSVRAELNASSKRISDAISAHEQGMHEAMQSNRLNVLRMVGRTWFSIAMVSVLLIATSGSVLWWQGQKIVANMQTLSQQETSLAQLNAKTWGVSFRSDGNGKFLVLPAGMKVDTNWTVQNGKRNAVKLVKEP
ncbi:MbeB family mobilization protein [Erwinia sp. INIA-01]|uniref:MbeB family mobilization protein n=1 Tax=Erwinia sp. INIA01 TaxID=2991500 RepID=UPI002225708E|nr:MbeB family mobilization protein [Erwinia sp. INIA01]MCW1877842.1 MbeB family mobilization protein [Erwinia sp. INIA01]